MLDKGCTGASSRGRARAHDAVVHAQNGAQLALHKRLYAPPPAGGRRRRRAQLKALQALQTRLNTFAQRQARARTCSWQHCCCSDARLRVSCACCRQWH